MYYTVPYQPALLVWIFCMLVYSVCLPCLDDPNKTTSFQIDIGPEDSQNYWLPVLIKLFSYSLVHYNLVVYKFVVLVTVVLMEPSSWNASIRDHSVCLPSFLKPMVQEFNLISIFSYKTNKSADEVLYYSFFFK